MFFFIALASGKVVEYLVDNYVVGQPNAAKDLAKASQELEETAASREGSATGAVTGKRGMFMTENEVDDELGNCQKIAPAALKAGGFFGQGRNFFIWVKPSSADLSAEELEERNKDLMHFFHLKKLCRKKDQPLYAYCIDPADYENEAELLRTQLNIESTEELHETAYILVNEDTLKLAQQRNHADPAISFKFLQNPLQVNSIDDLYDLLDINKELPVKYFMMMKDEGVRPKDFTLQSKLFRKAFYENSAAIEDLAVFAEVTNSSLARKVGLTGKD